MDWWLASFFLGALLSLFLPIVPEFFVLFLFLLLSLCIFYYSFKLNKPLCAGSGLLFGASWMLFNAWDFQQVWQENNINVVDLSTKTQWVQGQVLSLYSPQIINNKTLAKNVSGDNVYVDKRLRFNFNVTHLNNHKLNNTIQLRLSWKNGPFALQQGQVVRLKVKVKPSHGLANLGSFSYQTWLNSNRISATGYVINHKDNQIFMVEQSIRQQLFSAYKAILPNHDLVPLLLALGFGSRSELSPDLWQVLQTTGTGHLIAISGLHIGLVATASYLFITLFIRLLPLRFISHSYRLQALNVRYIAIGLSMVMAGTYGYLAGFSLPTIRALVMLSLFWLIRLLAVNMSLKRWLLFTLLLLTLIAPFSLFSPSFWLSVYAVIVIFLTLWRFKNIISTGTKWWRFFKGLVVIQLSLTLMLLPISAVFFQQVSLLALFANIISVPWMSFFSIPLCLLSVLMVPVSQALSGFLIMLCLESVALLWHYLSFLSSASWLVIELSTIAVQLFVFAGLLSLFYLFFQPKLSMNKKSVAASLTSIIMLFTLLGAVQLSSNQQPRQQLSHWQLIVFDVGQGLSVLIQRQNRAILYDTGASYASGFNMIEAVVLPYLQHAGIKQLDKVVISHSDNDHAGGLAALQQSIPINELVYNGNSDNVNLDNVSSETPASVCVQGKRFHWQGLTIDVLWPEKNVAKENDDSCVLLISDGKHQVLLTGDISAKVEAQLIHKYPQLRSDVLVVPHHGSKTSSSVAFISQIKPKFGIVSAGFLNRWHMPVMEVVNRYQTNNVPLLNSAESGQIIVNFSAEAIMTQTYHDDLWPFWFSNSY